MADGNITVTVRLPKVVNDYVAAIARTAKVSPSTVIRVILAARIVGLERDEPKAEEG